MSGQRVINLSEAPGERSSWDRPIFIVFLWSICELLLVTNPWQISSKLRVSTLRLFGAKIGDRVVFRPRTRVRFPWKLEVGDRCWIGEGVWLHNQNQVTIGADVVLSQDTFLTTGSHRVRHDMALVTRPIEIRAGAWVTSRCVVLGGAHIGESAIITPLSVVGAEPIPAGEVWGGNPIAFRGHRFNAED